ncbi:uncharacterized protein LACBIDRAFT_328047 [Laccaria bicolor S238N-H82]|uniref:Predicted protein n=1 Tax=Laccaria bicolor (strain S238N-H82 / ATCC MYA-4686) TaxID=486041 RepID=B0DDL0_LACBS|nr:uncharacterized protein LACBIDRAFT_328047 [Laccaria bicolor S238N-H82]EDR07106.1 predicted protein [Laccaria bicolor S238N-H82]|eukprot:XP_001882037.1 predicted protein [Laccaria bicolor S238N-H82]
MVSSISTPIWHPQTVQPKNIIRFDHGINATLLSGGGDACNGDTESAPGTTTHTPISAGANTAPSSSTDATPSNNMTPAPPPGDGPSDKENHAPLTELTHYEKVALTRACKKHKVEEALGALDKGANRKGDSEKGSKGSGKKRKEPEGGKEPEGTCVHKIWS